MIPGDLCTHCQLAEVVLVPANLHWNPEHLQCPRCDSTFIVETVEEDFCQYCCNTGESHGKYCDCKAGQRLSKLEIILTDQDGHKTIVRGKRADYVLNMMASPAVSMSVRVDKVDKTDKPVFVELIATETVGVVPMNVTPEAQDMLDRITTKTRPCTMCGWVRSKDKCGTLRYFCRHRGNLDSDALECEHYVPQGDDYKSDSTISDYK